MKWFRRLAALVLGLTLILSLGGCGGNGDEREIRATLKSFASACQQLDLNAMLDCMSPDAATPLRGGASLMGTLTGKTPEEILDQAVPFLFGDDYASSDFLRSLRLKVEDIAVAEDTATALCTLSYTLEGEKKERDMSIQLVKLEVEGESGWYISSLN